MPPPPEIKKAGPIRSTPLTVADRDEAFEKAELEAGETAVAEIAERVRVEIDRAAIFPEHARKSLCWYGVVPHSSEALPFHNHVVAGLNFCKIVGVENNQGDRVGALGQTILLSEKQVVHVKAQIAKQVVRRIGTQHRVYTIDDVWYQPDANDVPLAAHLYMYKLDERNPHNRPTQTPEPMLQEA
jgi:hypothetical protein